MSLNSFLCSLQLGQYHETFINTGVTDQDWHQLAQFTDQELEEFVSAANMLPFHSIKFKKAIKGLQKEPDNDVLATQEFVKTNAIIYGKNKKRALTSYEEAINRASLEIALENPLLVSKKGQLFDLAKKKLLKEGYEYKRGSSRSKLNDNSAPPRKKTLVRDSSSLLLKRQENAQRTSEKRLKKINLLTAEMEQAILRRQESEQRLSECEDDILSSLACKAEIIRLEETKIKLSRELSKLKAKERKHQWYKKRKSSLSSLSNNDEDEGFFSSQQSSINDFSISSSCSSFDEQCPKES